MAADACMIIEAVELDGSPLASGHAVLIIDEPANRPLRWHVAVLGLRLPPALPREGLHRLTARTLAGRRLSGRVLVDAATHDMSYICLRGVGSLSGLR